jgi:hypothetical protein
VHNFFSDTILCITFFFVNNPSILGTGDDGGDDSREHTGDSEGSSFEVSVTEVSVATGAASNSADSSSSTASVEHTRSSTTESLISVTSKLTSPSEENMRINHMDNTRINSSSLHTAEANELECGPDTACDLSMFAGKWVQDTKRSDPQFIETIGKKLGTPWMVRKAMARVAGRKRIDVDGINVVFVSAAASMTVTRTLVLDGSELVERHPFDG